MIDVKQTLEAAEERMEMAAMFLEEELNRIRAGRANVAILSGVRVESYGQKVPLNQVANVSTPDARTIAIKPWDRKQIKDIENAIMDTLNCHNKELVYKINVAWSLSIYQSNFAHILYAIAQRDAKEIKDNFDCIIKTPEDAMANAHMILENVCDDSDLEIILNFIGWKDNVFNEE